MEGFAEGRCAIKIGGFIESDGDLLQSGEVDDHRVTDPPGGHDDQDVFGEVHVAEPVGSNAKDGFDDGVDDARFAVEEPEPEDSERYGGNECGKKEEGSIERLAFDFGVEEHREGYGDNGTHGDGDEGIVERIPEALPEEFVAEDVGVVFKSDPDWWGEDGVFGEAVVEGFEEREQEEDCEPDEPRGGKQQA